MINLRDPSLLQSTGYKPRPNVGTDKSKFTIIYNNYLKNIREELLEENCYIKNINRKVINYIKPCHICQLVKTNNEKKEGTMIPITSKQKLEKIFLDICGPFPRSGGRYQYNYIIIIMDHFTKFIKLYPINRATTQKIIEILSTKYIPEVGVPQTIITDHGTQFRGKRWKNTLLELGIKTYKTSVYHPSSNPAERALREVGRILRTYCHDQQ